MEVQTACPRWCVIPGNVNDNMRLRGGKEVERSVRPQGDAEGGVDYPKRWVGDVRYGRRAVDVGWEHGHITRTRRIHNGRVAEDSLGSDRNGYRREFLQLVRRARQSRR